MKKQAGFTLIETLIAIFLLTLTVGGLLTMAAGGYFAVRYARNQIVADNLIQESLEYVRNSRDTALQSGTDWPTWLAGYTGSSHGCLTGCIVDPYATANNVRLPDSNGGLIEFFPSIGSQKISFYGYQTSSYNLGAPNTPPYLTTYKRIITFSPVTTQSGGTAPDQAVVTVKITWSNGNSSKSSSQSILLTNWQIGS